MGTGCGLERSWRHLADILEIRSSKPSKRATCEIFGIAPLANSVSAYDRCQNRFQEHGPVVATPDSSITRHSEN